MVEKRIPIQVAEAVERVMEYAKIGEVEEVSITESYGEFLGKMLSLIMTFLILIVLLTMVSQFERKIRKKQIKRMQLSLK